MPEIREDIDESRQRRQRLLATPTPKLPEGYPPTPGWSDPTGRFKTEADYIAWQMGQTPQFPSMNLGPMGFGISTILAPAVEQTTSARIARLLERKGLGSGLPTTPKVTPLTPPGYQPSTVEQIQAAKVEVPEWAKEVPTPVKKRPPVQPVVPPVEEARTVESKLKDVWDAFRVGATQFAHRTKQAIVGPIADLLFSIQPEEELWYPPELAQQAQQERQQMRNAFVQKYTEAEQKHQEWIEAHPELQPRPEWEGRTIETIKANPKILLDPAYLAHIAAESAAFTLAFLGTSVVVGGATGNPFLGLAAGVAVTSPAIIEDLYSDLLANGASRDQASALAVPIGSLISSVEIAGALPILGVVSKPFANILRREIQRELATLTVKEIAKRGLVTFTKVEIAEILEEVTQQAIQNATVKTFNENRGLLEGIPETVIRTAIATLPFGAGTAGIEAYTAMPRADIGTQLQRLAVSEAGRPAMEAGEQAAKAVGKEPWQMTKEEYVDFHVRSPAMHRYGVEKALKEGKPVPPQVLADYPDLVKAVPEAKALTVVGREAVAYGPDPTRPYQMKYRLVDLGDLIPSHTDAFAPNPAYPKELQPRMRERGLNRMWVSNTAKKLMPESLVYDTRALDTGLPIVGPDMVVESGNGRVMAMRLAQQEHPERWAAYQEALRESLPQFGIPEEQLAKMQNPVIVRERITPVDRVRFAQEANQPVVVAMSPFENAVQDAGRVHWEKLYAPEETMNLDATLRLASNREFITDFLAGIPANERAMLVDAMGEINLQGVQRLEAAMFASSYPEAVGKRLTAIFFEVREPIVRSIEEGMKASLPKVGRAEYLIRSGARQADLSIAEDIAAVVDVFVGLKQEKMPVAQYLDQAQLFERRLTPFQEQLLSYLDTIARSPKAIRQFLGDYADAVVVSPDLRQAVMVARQRVTKEGLLNAVIKREAEGPLFAALEEAPISPAIEEAAGRVRVEEAERIPEAEVAAPLPEVLKPTKAKRVTKAKREEAVLARPAREPLLTEEATPEELALARLTAQAALPDIGALPKPGRARIPKKAPTLKEIPTLPQPPPYGTPEYTKWYRKLPKAVKEKLLAGEEVPELPDWAGVPPIKARPPAPMPRTWPAKGHWLIDVQPLNWYIAETMKATRRVRPSTFIEIEGRQVRRTEFLDEYLRALRRQKMTAVQAQSAYEELLRGIPNPFGIDDAGIIAKGSPATMGKAIGDVMEWSGKKMAGVSPDESQFILNYRYFRRSIEDWARKRGANLPQDVQLQLWGGGKPKDIFPRFVEEVRGIQRLRGMIRGGVGARQSIEFPRVYPQQIEGIESGVNYLTDLPKIMGIFARMMARKVSDAEVLAELLPLTKKIVPKKGKNPLGWGEAQLLMRGFAGRKFPAEVNFHGTTYSGAEFAERILAEIFPPQHEVTDTILHWLAKPGNIARNAKVVVDLATGFIQPWPLLTGASAPLKRGGLAKGMVDWAKVMGQSLYSILHPAVLREFRVANWDAWARFIEAGGTIRTGTEYIATEEATMMARLPLVGTIVQRAQTAFGTALDLGVFKHFQALDAYYEAGVRPPTELVDFVQKLMGVPSIWRAIKPGQQQDFERSFGAFAPDYLRATMALYEDFFKPGLEGELARSGIIKFWLGTAFLFAAIAGMYDLAKGEWHYSNPMNKDFILNPDSRFWARLPLLGKIYVGLSNMHLSFMRTVLGVSLALAKGDVEDAWDDLSWFGRSRMAVTPQIARALITWKTYAGKKITGAGEMAKELLSNFLPMWGEQALEVGGTLGPLVGILEFMGLNISSITPWAKLDIARNELAQAQYQTEWENLNDAQQIMIERANPQLGELERVYKEQRQEVDLNRILAEQAKVSEGMMKKLPKNFQEALQDAGVTIGVNRTIGANDFYLNDERYERYQALVIEHLTKVSSAILNSKSWQNYPDEAKKSSLQTVVSDAREAARITLTTEINKVLPGRTPTATRSYQTESTQRLLQGVLP